MAAYYNEIDPYAAQWLRNLIAAGHIAPGDVDERSIEDVTPHELRGYSREALRPKLTTSMKSQTALTHRTNSNKRGHSPSSRVATGFIGQARRASLPQIFTTTPGRVDAECLKSASTKLGNSYPYSAFH